MHNALLSWPNGIDEQLKRFLPNLFYLAWHKILCLESSLSAQTVLNRR